MLTWETATPPELKGPHDYDPMQGAVKLILDGQQRITTLYMLIRGDVPPYYTEEEIKHDTRNLYVNLETLELSYYMKTRMENNPLWRNINKVFQREVRGKDVVRALEERNETVTREREDKIDDNAHAITSILDRDFPEQTIPIKASIREAIDIFYKVNASGVSLTDAELALAQISGYWPQARDRFKAKLAALEEEGFVFKLDFLVYVLLGCLYHMGSDMRKLHGEENKERLQDAWDQLEGDVLDLVVNLLRTHAYVDHSKELSSPYVLVPLIVYCFDKQEMAPTDAERRKMVKWFYYAQLRARYVSQLPQKLDRDLRMLDQSDQPFDDLLQVIAEDSRLKIETFEFVGRDVRHPLFTLMRWYFKSRNAVCFTTGVGLRQTMGKKYQLERDHIFPYSRLKNVGYGHGNRLKYSLAQEFTNRAVLTQRANRNKSCTSAFDYLSEVKTRSPEALELQCIPADEDLWKVENYEEFLQARRQLLADHLNAFLEGITETSETSLPVTLTDIIQEGESDVLEFKSTLRWDLVQGEVNKRLEEVVLKTIAAFANSDGGTLLIGVSDLGEVVGLEDDFLSLGGSQDKFARHCHNLVKQRFGLSSVAGKIKVTFWDVNEGQVCQIEVAQATEPLILESHDKNGQKVERLYVRSGSSSHEMPLSEMSGYLKERFNQRATP